MKKGKLEWGREELANSLPYSTLYWKEPRHTLHFLLSSPQARWHDTGYIVLWEEATATMTGLVYFYT
jgi:hypothetical protein